MRRCCRLIRHAGSVFVGPYSPEAAGDYASGPNHVLPTSGVARLRGGLSAADFVKVISVQELSFGGLAKAGARDHDAGARRRAWRRTRARWRCAVAEKADLPPACSAARGGAADGAVFTADGGRAGKLRLDFNENTVGCSPQVIEFLREQLNAGLLAVYPEYGEAKAALGAVLRRARRSSSCFTNGTDEAIQVLINTYVDDGDDVLLLTAVLRDVPLLRGGGGRGGPRNRLSPGDLAFPLEELLEAIAAQDARGPDRQSQQSDRHRRSALDATSNGSSKRPRTRRC